MQKTESSIVSKLIFYLALILIVYMPLHVFIVQSASLLTGGIEYWKAAKDVLVFTLGPGLLFVIYKRGLFQDRTFRTIAILGSLYALLHGLFLLFDQNDDTYSAIVGSVYNTRILIYLLLGYLVGTAKNAQKYLKILLTSTVLIASATAIFGIAQYFLPADLLENVGYTLERGVKPLFFIDDKPELPRVMSTLKDPNSFGAYLILPILLTGYALLNKQVNKSLFVRPFRIETLLAMSSLMFIALVLTFSRGALIGLTLSVAVLLFLNRRKIFRHVPEYFTYIAAVGVVLVMLLGVGGYFFRDSAFVQDYVLHSATTTDQEDPNEKRITLQKQSIEDVLSTPEGHGPGSAGLVSITNPKGGVLTENYYLQIGYEVGWLGLVIFLSLLSTIIYQLSNFSQKSTVSVVLLSALFGYLFYSLLIHLWSNEAIALQWWLLTGVVLSIASNLAKK